MNKKSLLFLAFITLIAVSCNKFSQFTNIDKNVPYSYQIEVPELPNGILLPPGGTKFSFPEYTFATNSDQYVSEAGSREDLIVHVKLQSLIMRMLQPDTADFDFVDTLRVYVSSQGLPEQLAAYKYGVPNDTDSLALDVVDLDLQEYFKQDSMSLRLEGHFFDFPPENGYIDVSSIFQLRANPLN